MQTLPSPTTLIPLCALGLFCALAYYSWARFVPEGTAYNMRRALHSKPAPVYLWRASDVTREQCGEDWLCLLAWSEGKLKKPSAHIRPRHTF